MTNELLTTCTTKIQELKSLIEKGDILKAKICKNELKISLLGLPSLPPCGSFSATATQENLLSREAFEWFTCLSIKEDDMQEFDRNIVQLRIYYTDLVNELPPSPRQYSITGMYLVLLLIENRMAEFHEQLELIPHEKWEENHIAFAIKLERYLMEGSYSKLLEARSQVPDVYFKYFMDQLLDTVREAVASCAQVAYEKLNVNEAQRMLMFNTQKELMQYIEKEKKDWKIQENFINFQYSHDNVQENHVSLRERRKQFETCKEEVQAQTCHKTKLSAFDIPSLSLIKNTLAYSTELDRIV